MTFLADLCFLQMNRCKLSYSGAIEVETYPKVNPAKRDFNRLTFNTIFLSRLIWRQFTQGTGLPRWIKKKIYTFKVEKKFTVFTLRLF